jgi:hypothetical protein
VEGTRTRIAVAGSTSGPSNANHNSREVSVDIPWMYSMGPVTLARRISSTAIVESRDIGFRRVGRSSTGLVVAVIPSVI